MISNGRLLTENPMKFLFRTLAALLAACALGGAAHGADAVKIGVIYPLTGNAAPAGNSAKDAIELGAEIVNGQHPELKGSGLAGADGLTKLGGAKVELINADHQGNPQVGQSQTLRLIQQEKVAAMLGAYHSWCPTPSRSTSRSAASNGSSEPGRSRRTSPTPTRPFSPGSNRRGAAS